MNQADAEDREDSQGEQQRKLMSRQAASASGGGGSGACGKLMMLSTGSSPENSENDDEDDDDDDEEDPNEPLENYEGEAESGSELEAGARSADRGKQEAEEDESSLGSSVSQIDYSQMSSGIISGGQAAQRQQQQQQHQRKLHEQEVNGTNGDQLLVEQHHHHRAVNQQQQQQRDQKDYEDVKQVELFGVSIVALTINSKERLCLAQISNTLLKQFSYNEIHNRRVALGITCVQCTPIQLEMLRRAGAMPSSSRRCGMITMREAERLCRSFLVEEQPPELPENFYFTVAHRVNYGCKGRFVPARYISSRAKCIECFYCGEFYSPNKFIFHYHRQPHTTDCNPPDSPNINSWRKHIDLDLCHEHSQEIKYAWEDVKSLFNGGTRRRAPQTGVNGGCLGPTAPGNMNAAAAAAAAAALIVGSVVGTTPATGTKQQQQVQSAANHHHHQHHHHNQQHQQQQRARSGSVKLEAEDTQLIDVDDSISATGSKNFGAKSNQTNKSPKARSSHHGNRPAGSWAQASPSTHMATGSGQSGNVSKRNHHHHQNHQTTSGGGGGGGGNSLMLNSASNQSNNRASSSAIVSHITNLGHPTNSMAGRPTKRSVNSIGGQQQQQQQQPCNKLFSAACNMVQDRIGTNQQQQHLANDLSGGSGQDVGGGFQVPPISPCAVPTILGGPTGTSRATQATQQPPLLFSDFMGSPASRCQLSNETQANSNHNHHHHNQQQQPSPPTSKPMGLIYSTSPNFIYGQLYSQLMQQQQQPHPPPPPPTQLQQHHQTSQQQQLTSASAGAATDAQLALRHHLWSSLLANLQCNTGNNQTYSLQQQQAAAAASNLEGLCNQGGNLVNGDMGVSDGMLPSISHLLAAHLYPPTVHHQQHPVIGSAGVAKLSRTNQNPIERTVGYKTSQTDPYSLHKSNFSAEAGSDL